MKKIIVSLFFVLFFSSCAHYHRGLTNGYVIDNDGMKFEFTDATVYNYQTEMFIFAKNRTYHNFKRNIKEILLKK
jgi:hypothetical protein